ncbi:ClpP/crotonase-like domain-containing protein [Microdochium bolleyi]|uniref:ClpP/crotonase-like domain-containing protein n=1 Tax=Microdochium bolleyi TaxID=196109 RepID=A0A136IQN9_9PEZI|nr:ClpP/crotonase-like domain-containing protein [Microdochium bolleyi]
MAPSPPPTHHFTVPISPIPNHPGGSVICTEPSPQVYLLTFSSPPDNRLTHAFVTAFLTALDLVETRFAPSGGVVVTTSAIPKFYSNGLDLDITRATDRFLERYMYRLLARVMAFPMPTIALVNGHAFAGGIMMAMHHDYRVFAPSIIAAQGSGSGAGAGAKRYLCVNEIDFGAALTLPLINIYQLKCHPTVVRDIILEGKRWTGAEALRAGTVDRVVEGEGGDDAWDKGVMELVRTRKLVDKSKTGVYRVLKRGMYREQLALLESEGRVDEMEAIAGMTAREEAERAAVRSRAGKVKL